MKTMTPILLVTSILTACSPNPEPSPGSADPGASASASASAGPVRPACAVSDGGNPPAGKVTPGCYKVCSPSDPDVKHEGRAAVVTGAHLRANDRLEIGPIGGGGSEVWMFESKDESGSEHIPHQVDMSGDDTDLRGFRDFAHKKNGSDVNVTHQVKIVRVANEHRPTSCKDSDNVLKVFFCIEVRDDKGRSAFECDPQERDLGHAHVEN
jgi:hypothetical protein